MGNVALIKEGLDREGALIEGKHETDITWVYWKMNTITSPNELD